ncbi:MAG: hypothetical protein RLZZ397_1337 [Pseudomonadota bacterium]|jgi:hypothetical protein
MSNQHPASWAIFCPLKRDFCCSAAIYSELVVIRQGSRVTRVCLPHFVEDKRRTQTLKKHLEGADVMLMR